MEKVSPPTSVQEFTTEEFFGGTNASSYVHAAERIRQLNHSSRAGDVIIAFRSRTDDPLNARHTSSSNIPSWHGSLNRSDSYVPFIVSYPGGNADAIKAMVRPNGVCASEIVCDSTLKVAGLVKEILHFEIGQE
jgi:hypothetical protein